jgi:hypothetical protein
MKKKKEQHTNLKFIKLTLQDRVLGLTTWIGFIGGTGYHEELEPLDEEHSPMSWMSYAFPMLEVIGIRWHCARPQISLRILRTHCPKNGTLRSVIRSKSH